MTAKEKADELIKKFSPLVTTWDCYHDTPANPDSILQDAKKCALIAVDELIEHCSQVEPFLGVDYWQDVKTEIEKL
jgi:hypothetical protein